MRSTFKVLFYLKKGSERKDGQVMIMARITIDGNIAQFSTKQCILPTSWNVKSGKVKGRDAGRVNALLEDIRSSLNKIYHDQQRDKRYVTAETVKTEFLGYSIKHETILTLFKEHNDNIKKQIGITIIKPTYQKYEVTRRHLAEFILSEYKLSDVPIRDIDHEFITGFELFLRTECKCCHNTTVKFLQFFKRIIIIARNKGQLRTNPFADYKIRLEEVDKGNLTIGEIVLILQKKMVSKRLEQVRDLFIFSCFTGLAYIDVMNLKAENIRENFDGRLWIMTKRQKTNVKVNVPLLAIPKMILDKYEGELPQGKLLPVISNQKLNAYLKEIGDVCGIQKKLTFHLARHTFATALTMEKGIPLDTVSKMLGHRRIETTRIYARTTEMKISNDMNGLDNAFMDVHNIAQEVFKRN